MREAGLAPPGREAEVPATARDADVPARLDGIRAWLAELDRALSMRTRIGLVLVALAIGGAAAAIYLAMDADDESASEREVGALREELSEARERTEAAEADADDLRTTVEALGNQVDEANKRTQTVRRGLRNLRGEVEELRRQARTGAAAPGPAGEEARPAPGETGAQEGAANETQNGATAGTTPETGAQAGAQADENTAP